MTPAPAAMTRRGEILKYANLHDGLEHWRDVSPDKVAVEMDLASAVTYSQLGSWSDGVARRLAAEGVQPGDRIVVVGSNSLALIASAFGILKVGAIVVPLNDRFTAPELRHLIEFSGAAVVIADGPRQSLVASLNLPVPLLSFDEVNGLRDIAADRWHPVHLPANAIAMIVFTSGSTGSPKGVMLSHADHLGRFLEIMLFSPGLGPNTNAMMPMGIQGAPGTAWGYMFSSVIGGTFYFNSKYDAEKTLRTLIEKRIDFLNAVPLIYKEISRLPRFAQADLSNLTFARCGGSRLPSETWQAWSDNGVTIRTLYGMSEIGGNALIATIDEAKRKPESCGKGMFFTRFRIVRADGSECDANEPGAVLLRGPGIMAGYWRDSAATEETIQDGWLHTGDIGLRDEDGEFFFVDRAKELVKCGGFNVSPQEIENLLLEIDGVDEVAVFAVADERYTEVPFALVFSSKQLQKSEIFAFCKARIANFKLPRYIEFIENPLPRLVRGKIDKQSLKKAYADAEGRFEKAG